MFTKTVTKKTTTTVVTINGKKVTTTKEGDVDTTELDEAFDGVSKSIDSLFKAAEKWASEQAGDTTKGSNE